MLDRLKWVINFNSQNNLDFAGPASDPNMRLRDALQQAYYREIEMAQAEVGLSRFYRTKTFVWPASQVTLVVPDTIKDKQFVVWRDVTNSTSGDEIMVGSNRLENDVWEIGADMFQWGTTGPASDTSVEATFLAEAEELVANEQTPLLIPSRYRWLLVYSAAEVLFGVADPRVPEFVTKEANRLRLAYQKSLSRGRFINSDAPVIQNDDYP
jgi:hypothetical protein